MLRRPPDNAISASAANGVRREYRMLRALAGHARVPAPLGFCDDATIIGQPFIVVEHVDGTAISTDCPRAIRRRGDAEPIGAELVDAMALSMPWTGANSASRRAPRGSYVSRQVERWLSAREADAVRECRSSRTGRWLLAHCPATAPGAVIHGDFHLDNTLFRNDSPLLAVIIDWELARSAIRSRTSGSPCVLGRPSRRSIGFPFVQRSVAACRVARARLLRNAGRGHRHPGR